MKTVKVVAGLIRFGEEVLCMQRKESKYNYISHKFEFPGGKIEEGETEQEALKRELREEMEMEVEIGNKFLSVVHEYPDFILDMQVFECKASSKDFVMKEHISFEWSLPKNIPLLDWAGADLPVVKKILG